MIMAFAREVERSTSPEGVLFAKEFSEETSTTALIAVMRYIAHHRGYPDVIVNTTGSRSPSGQEIRECLARRGLPFYGFSPDNSPF